MAFLQPRDRGNGAETNALRLRLVFNQLTQLCGSFTAHLLISSEQSEKTLVQRLDLSRQKLGVQNLESFGHELELTIPDRQKQMKRITA